MMLLFLLFLVLVSMAHESEHEISQLEIIHLCDVVVTAAQAFERGARATPDNFNLHKGMRSLRVFAERLKAEAKTNTYKVSRSQTHARAQAQALYELIDRTLEQEEEYWTFVTEQPRWFSLTESEVVTEMQWLASFNQIREAQEAITLNQRDTYCQPGYEHWREQEHWREREREHACQQAIKDVTIWQARRWKRREFQQELESMHHNLQRQSRKEHCNGNPRL